MSKEIYISSTPHETRLAIVEDEALTEIYYERENEYTLAGSIYNGRVTRVLPGMQSSFVDIGLERDAFLYITDFLEEAPDAEEFDTAPAGDRAPRINGGDRPDEARGSERGADRGNRGRRGGRDRNQDRGPERSPERGPDRPPVAELPARPPAAELAPRQPARGDAQRFNASAGEASAPQEADETSEIGEGAPGADGSRRWRGRRGRRRGRGPGAPAGPTGSAAPQDESAADTAAVYPGEEVAPAVEPYADIDAAALRQPDAPSDRDRNGQSRSSRRDQGRFQDPRPPRSPRGFTPSRDLYGVDSSTGPIANAYPDEASESAPEPLILPGESLSKYRKGDDQPAASASAAAPAASITLAPPANLYTLAAGWDGGDVLPGESLSRRRESRPESRGRVSDRQPRAESRPEPRAEVRADAAPIAATAQEHLEPQQPVAAAEATQEPAVATAAIAPESNLPVDPAPALESAPAAIAEEESEYEPQDASASYRVEPLARREFRQSAPVLEPVAPEPAAEVPAEPSEPVTPPPAASFEFGEGPGAVVQHPDAVAPGPEAGAQHAISAPIAEEHDITSISAAGEMLSEPPVVLTEAAAHSDAVESPAPASPILHEGTVISPEANLDLAEGSVGFTPGPGDLAEEIFEDEEPVGATLHASSIEEMDDLEEETLEGAADLGTMLREMSIDHITRTLPELEEQDDIEEDELEEDDLEDNEIEGYEIDDQPDLDDSAVPQDDEQAARTGTAEDREFFEAEFGQAGEQPRAEAGEAQGDSPNQPRRDSGREGERRGGRRDGRRDGRRGRSERPSGDRPTGDRNGHRSRHSMQSTNLPAISDLLKPGQEILVQIAKEPIAKKGARITSHIALPGRFLVFMPTVNHTGVSRKIESDGERRRLKEILLSEKGDATGGFIVRTAAEGASEEELRNDLRFLLNLWADIKARSESSKSPALIYHDLNLIERILRDQVTDNFSAIWVDSEGEYERVLRFLQRFQPSLIRRVKLYTKETPLFEQFGITEEINKALRSKVWLKSGGSIVINQTEALVAIDINTGKFVGKTARLEDTIVKTNLDAIPEIVRQIRLRDLGGIIIIDFIDMDERKNRNRVMAALEEELKSDRAPSKVLQFNDFGLVAITRKRVKQSLERTLSTTCAVCQGTGMVKSPVTVCNDIYIEMRKMSKHLDRGDVMLRVHPEVVKQLKSSGAKWLQEMEETVGKTILVKSDPSLHPEQFDIH